MYKAPSKRKKRTQLFFIYSLMIASVVAIVAILVLILLGYRFNRYDGKVEQGGLVQFDSRPSGADVLVDSARLANKTASRITLTTGPHTVTISKPGYTTWKKDVTVKAGAVLWLDYALLLPEKPATKTVATLPSAASSVVSNDRKLLAYVGAETEPKFYVATLNDATPAVETITVDSKYLTANAEDSAQRFAVTAWDKDNRHVIVQHTYNNDKQEYLLVDMRGNDETKNITRDLGVDIAQLECDLDDANLLYVVTTARDLRRINMADNTVSGPLVTNVAQFTQADRSTLSFATRKDSATGKRSVGYMTEGAQAPRTMRLATDEDSVPFGMLIGKYFGEQYMVFYKNDSVEIYKGDISASDSTKAPSLKLVKKFTTSAPITNAMFSPDEKRFIALQTANGADVYDLELAKQSKLAFPSPIVGTLQWLNRYHVATTSGGSFSYYDFDGTNGTMVASNVLPLPAVMSENSKFSYHFAQTTNGAQLIQTKLTTD
jgi:hypothetical protein